MLMRDRDDDELRRSGAARTFWDRGPLDRRDRADPRYGRVVSRGLDATDQEGPDAARQDRRQLCSSRPRRGPGRASRSPRNDSRPTRSTSPLELVADQGRDPGRYGAQSAGDGPDLIVVRHAHPGVPQMLAERVDAGVINAGDGAHEHPTQALLDAFTIRQHKGVSRAEDLDRRRHRAQPCRAFEHPPADRRWVPR